MNGLLKFRTCYFILTILIFAIEVLIALFVHDRFIRPYFGDFLVVILLYCGFRSFLNIRPFPTAIGVFLIACTIEALQYFHLVNRLGLSHSRLARIVLGSSFEWTDIVTYAAGILCTLLVEWWIARRRAPDTAGR